MASVFLNASANARKSGAKLQAEVLQRLALVTQTRVAERLGAADSTVSRWVSEGELERCSLILAAAGLKVVELGTITVKPDELRMLKKMAAKYLLSDLELDGEAEEGVE